MTPWEIQATGYASCNCDYGCPCQFNALPTNGNCQAVGFTQVNSGHYGDIDLSNTRFCWILSWPGAVHEGHGTGQVVIDKNCTQAQTDALIKIIAGEDTDPAATVFAVYSSTLELSHEPIICDLDLEINVEERTAKAYVEDLVQSVGEPIRNPITGEKHRVRIDVVGGFEYTLAEMGSTTTTTKGKIPLDWSNTYGQFAHIHLNNHGIVSN